MLQRWTCFGSGAWVATLCAALGGGCSRSSAPTPASSAKPVDKTEACEPTGWCVVRAADRAKPETRLCSLLAAGDDVWVAGNTVARWDGTSWGTPPQVPDAQVEEKGCAWYGLGSAGAGFVWLSGRPGSWLWDGKSFARAEPASGASFFAGVSPRDVWGATYGSAPTHWDGKTWSRAEDLKLQLAALYCASSDACWAGGGWPGRDGTTPAAVLLRYDGKTWRREPLPERMKVFALAGSGAADVWAAGEGSLLHFDGSRWRAVPSRFQGTVKALAVRQSSDVWAAGSGGVVLHFDGKDWGATKIASSDLKALALTSAHAWALTEDGELLRSRRAVFDAKVPPAKDAFDPDRSLPSIGGLDSIARGRAERYQAALAQGRGATRAKRFADADAAFTRALAESPDDARALCERGYSRSLAGRDPEASLDFTNASLRTDDPALRAQIFFNLGLSNEARGGSGQYAFAISQFLHPTAAAKAKLTTGSACPVAVERSPNALLPTPYPNWLALANGLPLQAPSSEAEARERLCREGACAGKGPWLVGDPERFVALVRPTPTGLSASIIALSQGDGFCPNGARGEVIYQDDDVAVVRAFGGTGKDVVVCFDEDAPDSEHACTDQERELMANGSGFQNFIHGCNWHSFTRYVVLDKASGQLPISLTVDDNIEDTARDAEEVTVQAGKSGLTVRGLGCNLDVPYRPAN